MPGGLIQLVMYGAQDIYLTGADIPQQQQHRRLREPEPPTDRSLPREDPCPITFEPFNPGNIYAECQQCHHCFHSDAIRRSLEVAGWKCPMCRTPWEEQLTFYRVPFATG